MNGTIITAVKAFYKDESAFLMWNRSPFKFGCKSMVYDANECRIPSGDNYCNCGNGLIEHPGKSFRNRSNLNEVRLPCQKG